MRILLALLLCLLGCRTAAPPRPFTGLELVPGVRFYSGSAFAPRLEDVSLPAAPAAFTPVQLRAWAVQTRPAQTVEPLVARASAIVAYPGTLIAAPELGREAMVAVGEAGEGFLRQLRAGAYGKQVALDDLRTVLCAELNTQLGYEEPDLALRVVMRQTSEGLRWSLVFEQTVQAKPGGWPESVFHQERFLLDPAYAGATRTLVVLVPWPFLQKKPPAEGQTVPHTSGLVVAVTVEDPPASGTVEHQAHSLAITACRESLRADLEQQAARKVRENAAWQASYEELLPLRYPRSRRSTLTYLADRAGATLMQQIAMTGDSELLRACADGLLETEKVPSEPEAFGWLLERFALLLLAKDMATGELPPERASLLVQRAGEVGRHPSQLGDMAAAAESLVEFDERLVHANLAHLEANQPSHRVRAFDWLRARGQAPPGYAPLASKVARSQALRAALSTGGP